METELPVNTASNEQPVETQSEKRKKRKKRQKQKKRENSSSNGVQSADAVVPNSNPAQSGDAVAQGTVSKKKKNETGNSGRPVDKATVDKYARILQNFMRSDENVYKFDAYLGSEERLAVHNVAHRMGLKSKSYGSGKTRRLSVFKKHKKGELPGKKENLYSFRLSEEAKGELQGLFSSYPPKDEEMNAHKVVESSGRSRDSQAIRGDMFFKPAMSESEIARKVESVASRIEKSPKLRQISEARSKLPIASFRDVITSTIASNQVVLLCGETGCGKTTQVPQYLLDHSWSNGERCKIVCCQPRRISAISVAERVASERGEDIGDSVGYKIRLESKGGRQSSIVFCTSGVLLKVLVSKGFEQKRKGKKTANPISEITHIVVDEIHERDRFSDFMLAIIREILPLYPHLHVVLMSATLDANKFSEYFGGCPIIRVPGFTYPVKSFYLEDILSMVRSTEPNRLPCTGPNDAKNLSLPEDFKIALDEAIDSALSDDEFYSLDELISSEGNLKIYNYQHSKSGVTPLMLFALKGKISDIYRLLSLGVDCNLQCSAGKNACDYAVEGNQKEAAEIIKKHMETSSESHGRELLDKYLRHVNPEAIDYVLIEQLLLKICNDSKDGAILVFLPGWDDIGKTRDRLCSSPLFGDESKFIIISLHSMVPSSEQKKVFDRPPPGCRKIVLSTNIAETSVTIDDVVYVIDSGRMKEKSYDPVNNLSTLHSEWVSKANSKQRAGRAGRCQPGMCYHLYSRSLAASLLDFQVPEIQRMPIDEICLQVKLIDPSCKIEDFLNKTLDPPLPRTISNAIVALQDIGALSLDEKLTDLGEKLGSLPVHPRTSKMLFLAILLKCLDPALTLACASDYKDPFLSPMIPDEKEKAAAAKRELASFYGGHGDQLAVVAAIYCWSVATKHHLGSKFCKKYFLSENTVRMISGSRKQLEAELLRSGFIPENQWECNSNSRNPGILHLVLVAGLYPKVGLGKHVGQGKKFFIETGDGNVVRLKPSSVNTKLSFEDSSPKPLVIFDEIISGDFGLCIRNCSIVGSLPLLLLAKELAVEPSSKIDEKNCNSTESNNPLDSSNGMIMSSPEIPIKIVLDLWLPFHSTALDVAHIYCLRERLTAAILFKITHPHKSLPMYLEASLHAISCVLSYDGMSGISLQPVESFSNQPNNMEQNELSTDHLKWLIEVELSKTILDASSAPPRGYHLSHPRRYQPPGVGYHLSHPRRYQPPGVPLSKKSPASDTKKQKRKLPPSSPVHDSPASGKKKRKRKPPPSLPVRDSTASGKKKRKRKSPPSLPVDDSPASGKKKQKCEPPPSS